MTDASAVEPERSVVYTEPRADGERVLLTATTFVQLGDRQPRGRRALAVIAAGPDGVRVQPTPRVARLGAYALTAVAAVWCATRATRRR
jgi:hypothetical protein